MSGRLSRLEKIQRSGPALGPSRAPKRMSPTIAAAADLSSRIDCARFLNLPAAATVLRPAWNSILDLPFMAASSAAAAARAALSCALTIRLTRRPLSTAFMAATCSCTTGLILLAPVISSSSARCLPSSVGCMRLSAELRRPRSPMLLPPAGAGPPACRRSMRVPMPLTSCMSASSAPLCLRMLRSRSHTHSVSCSSASVRCLLRIHLVTAAISACSR
mmetsp:Transcript_38533/g.96862  ORF Transcript_38533/g.96862 Transcript_38533/m.96862 type:complete len:218 (+) Transcript_38533:1536-2189(+)